MKKIKGYYKAKYCEHSNDKLEIEITKNLDDIKYMFRKEIDTSKIPRKQLEELHEIMENLYWMAFDCMNLR